MAKKRVKWMDIGDKIEISETRCCPAHYWPHKLLPLGRLIRDENCHIHTSKWRWHHHKMGCKYIFKCRHYRFMLALYKRKFSGFL